VCEDCDVIVQVEWVVVTSQSFRNPKCLMIRDPPCMPVSEVHFSG